MCVNLAIGFVTPPMGANLFVASNLSKVSVFDIARKAVPFILAFLIALLLITFVPEILSLIHISFHAAVFSLEISRPSSQKPKARTSRRYFSMVAAPFSSSRR